LLFLNKINVTTPKKINSVKMVLFTCIFRYALSFLYYFSFNELKLKTNSKKTMLLSVLADANIKPFCYLTRGFSMIFKKIFI